MKKIFRDIDYQVLKLIPKSEERITIKSIAALLKITERQVYSSTERLKKHGVPIVSERIGENKGLFIATTEEERQRGLASFKHQIEAMEERIGQVNDAHINTWEMDMNNPDWREQATSLSKVIVDGKTFDVSFEFDNEDTASGSLSMPDELIELLTKQYFIEK